MRADNGLRVRRASVVLPGIADLGCCKSVALRTSSLTSAQKVSKARAVFCVLENHKDVGAVQGGQIGRRPGGGVFLECSLTGEPCERTEEDAIELVVVRRAEISVRAVPAPLSPIVPERERPPETVDARAEQFEDTRVRRLRPQVVEAEQAEQKAVEHPRQWETGVFLVRHTVALAGADSAVRDVGREHPSCAFTQIEQPRLAGDAMGSYEAAEDEALHHGGDPGSLQEAGPFLPIER